MSERKEKTEEELWEISVGEDASLRPEAIQELGVRRLAKGLHAEGLNFMATALEIWRLQEDLLGIGPSSYAQGTYHLGRKNPELAISFLEEAVSNYHNSFRVEWEGDALRALASAYLEVGRQLEAQDLLVRAIDCFIEVDAYFRAGLCQIELGNIYSGNFELHLSLRAFQGALEYAQKAEDPILALRSNTRISAICHALGDEESAIQILREALLTAEYIEDDEILILVKDDFAETLVESGRSAEALPILEEVSTFWKEQDSKILALGTDVVRVSALHNVGRTQEALELIAIVSATARVLNSLQNLINVALAEGEIWRSQKLHVDSLRCFLNAASLSASGNDPWIERFAWLCVAEQHKAIGNLTEALEILEELSLEAWGDCIREQSRHRQLRAELFEELLAS